jgi:hypothetical protein
LQQVGRFLGHTGHQINAVVTAAHHAQPTNAPGIVDRNSPAYRQSESSRLSSSFSAQLALKFVIICGHGDENGIAFGAYAS